MINDFIEIYDIPDLVQDIDMPNDIDLKEIINTDSCENIIEFFESIGDKDYNKDSGLEYLNKNRQKICAGKSLDFSSGGIINDTIFLFFI